MNVKNYHIYIIILSLMFFLGGCSTSNINKDHLITLKEPLKSIVDSFALEYPNRGVYEIYINKIEPHYCEIIVYAGKESLTKQENKDYDQHPLSCTQAANYQSFFVYTGSERYFESKIDPFISENNSTKILSNAFWAIKDSIGDIRVIKEYDAIYPFIKFPYLLDESFFNKLNKMIKEDSEEN